VPQTPPAESLELPDLDRAEESDEVDVGTFELDMDVGADADDDGAVDGFEVDIRELTDTGSNEAADDLDIGGDDLLPALPEHASERDDDVVKPDGEELDLHLDSPLESDEPSSDAELGDDGLEALPELIAEDGDGDAGPDVERAYLPSAPEGAIPSGPSYEPEWLLLGTPCTALTAARGSVIGAAAHLMRFGADGLEFRLVFWIADPQNGSGNVVSEVNIRVLQGLRAANIEIPYPQRVVRLVNASATEATG